MSTRRVDRIVQVLEKAGGRAKLSELVLHLRELEKNESVTYPAIYIAIQAENDRLEAMGERLRFRTSRQGEQRGWVSLEQSSTFRQGTLAQQIESLILEANTKVDEEIRGHLQSMDWRTFESTFLTLVLEKLGFQDVEVTQATRDGGTDARVSYRRGLVDAKAIVSAKRWASKAVVPVDEVRLMRGVKGDEDTAIIITTGRFSADAQYEARPSQNQRVVYLIDGDRLVDICKRYEIGIKQADLPHLLILDQEQFGPGSGQERDDDAVPEAAEEGTCGLRRFRDGMLDEIPVPDLASLLGLCESSVRSYLSVADRRRAICERIRANPVIRSTAIKFVEKQRGLPQASPDAEN